MLSTFDQRSSVVGSTSLCFARPTATAFTIQAAKTDKFVNEATSSGGGGGGGGMSGACACDICDKEISLKYTKTWARPVRSSMEIRIVDP